MLTDVPSLLLHDCRILPPHHVWTVAQCAQCILSSVRMIEEFGLMQKCMLLLGPFKPSWSVRLSRSSMFCHAVWLWRVQDKLQTAEHMVQSFPVVSIVTSSIEMSLRHVYIKTRPVQGRRHAIRVEYFHREATDELEKYRKLWVKFNVSLLTVLIRNLFSTSSGDTHSAKMMGVSSDWLLMSKVTLIWTQGFFQRFVFVIRAQSDNHVLSPQQEIFMRQQSESHLQEIQGMNMGGKKMKTLWRTMMRPTSSPIWTAVNPKICP